jgi:hypothetical protein
MQQVIWFMFKPSSEKLARPGLTGMELVHMSSTSLQQKLANPYCLIKTILTYFASSSSPPQSYCHVSDAPP